MAKKKVAINKATPSASTTSKVPAPQQTALVVFPGISPKEELECRTILEDQILVIDVGDCCPSTGGLQPDNQTGVSLSSRMQSLHKAY